MEQQVLTLRSVIDHADAVIFSVDRQYRYTSFNRAHSTLMDALYGTTPRLGVSLLDCMTSVQDRDLARQNVDRALAGEALVQEAYSGEDPATRRFLRVSHSPIQDAAGAVVGAAVVA